MKNRCVILAIIITAVATVADNRRNGSANENIQCPGLQMQVEVIAAIEGGPVVLAVSVQNDSGTVKSFTCHRDEFCSIDAPKSWTPCGPVRQEVMGLSGPYSIELQPGRNLLAIVPLQTKYCIPAGESMLSVHLTLRSRSTSKARDSGVKARKLPDRFELDDEDEERAEIEWSGRFNLQLTVGAATERSIDSVVRDLKERLGRSKRDDEIVVACLWKSKLAGLEPIARQLLTRGRPDEDMARWWMFENLSPAHMTEFVTSEVCRPDASSAREWLNSWRTQTDYPVPTAEQIRRIHASKNIWTRLYALLFFSREFSKDQRDQILAEAATCRVPMSASQLRALVAALDDPRYIQRERASAQISQYGARALPALRTLSPEASSAEARSRLEGLMAKIDKQTPDQNEREFMEQLPSYIPYCPAALPILRALAKNGDDTWVGKESRRQLAKHCSEADWSKGGEPAHSQK